MYGLDPGIQLVFIFLYGEIRDTRVYISPVLLPLCARVSPTNRYANVRVRLDPSCALSHRVSTFFHIWFFSKPNIPISSLDFDCKIEKRGK
jgi:hypothetical protein